MKKITGLVYGLIGLLTISTTATFAILRKYKEEKNIRKDCPKWMSGQIKNIILITTKIWRMIQITTKR